MKPTEILFLAVAISIVAVAALAEFKRTLDIKALATRFQMAYLGDTLPASLALGSTPPGQSSKIWHVLDGDLNGLRVVAFDYRIGRGKGSYTRTAIAAKTNHDIFALTSYETYVTVDRCGDWIVLYQPGPDFSFRTGRISVRELETRLLLIAT